MTAGRGGTIRYQPTSASAAARRGFIDIGLADSTRATNSGQASPHNSSPTLRRPASQEALPNQDSLPGPGLRGYPAVAQLSRSLGGSKPISPDTDPGAARLLSATSAVSGRVSREMIRRTTAIHPAAARSAYRLGKSAARGYLSASQRRSDDRYFITIGSRV